MRLIINFGHQKEHINSSTITQIIRCILRKIVVMLFNGGPVYFSYLMVSLYIFKLLRTIDTKKEIKTMYMR